MLLDTILPWLTTLALSFLAGGFVTGAFFCFFTAYAYESAGPGKSPRMRISDAEASSHTALCLLLSLSSFAFTFIRMAYDRPAMLDALFIGCLSMFLAAIIFLPMFIGVVVVSFAFYLHPIPGHGRFLARVPQKVFLDSSLVTLGFSLAVGWLFLLFFTPTTAP